MDKRTTKHLKPTPSKATESQDHATKANEKSAIRTASKQQFDKAHRKTSAQHAGLFRRLAE